MLKSFTARTVGAAIFAAAMVGPAVLATAGRAATAADGLVLKSVSVELPNGERLFPEGAGADTANQNCLGCHSAGMVLTQPPLSRATWDAEVHKMIGVFKAPVDAADAAVIVDYLTRIKGAAQP